MNEIEHNHHVHDVHEHHLSNHNQKPFWKHVHKDWRSWVIVFLMLVGIMIYVMTGDFSWRPRLHRHPPVSGIIDNSKTP